MARKASSRKPTLALPKPFARSPTARGKPARGLSAPGAADAAQQGLLQLSFARHAHGYGFLAAAAFLLNAVLLLTLGGQTQALPLPRSVTTNMVLWLLPAVAGALASWDAVRLKREPYRRHYVSTHFGTSAAGMVLFFIVAFAIILLMQQSLPEALVPWIYPLTVAAIAEARPTWKRHNRSWKIRGRKCRQSTRTAARARMRSRKARRTYGTSTGRTPLPGRRSRQRPRKSASATPTSRP